MTAEVTVRARIVSAVTRLRGLAASAGAPSLPSGAAASSKLMPLKSCGNALRYTSASVHFSSMCAGDDAHLAASLPSILYWAYSVNRR